MTNLATRSRAVAVLGAATATMVALSACGGVKTSDSGGDGAAAYPNGNIQMTVGASAGVSSDLISRAMSKGMSENLKVAMPVINKAGANGALAAKELKAAKADGYAISIQNASLFTITPLAVGASEFWRDPTHLAHSCRSWYRRLPRCFTQAELHAILLVGRGVRPFNRASGPMTHPERETVLSSKRKRAAKTGTVEKRARMAPSLPIA